MSVDCYALITVLVELIKMTIAQRTKFITHRTTVDGHSTLGEIKQKSVLGFKRGHKADIFTKLYKSDVSFERLMTHYIYGPSNS